MVEEKQQIGKWEVVELDIEGLVRAVSEAAWCAETKNKDQKLLYDEKGNVLDEWASVYWSLHSAYSELVSSYIKTDDNATEQKESGT